MMVLSFGSLTPPQRSVLVVTSVTVLWAPQSGPQPHHHISHSLEYVLLYLSALLCLLLGSIFDIRPQLLANFIKDFVL